MMRVIKNTCAVAGLLVISLGGAAFSEDVSVNFDQGSKSGALLASVKQQEVAGVPEVAEPKDVSQSASGTSSPRYGRALTSDILLSEKALNDYLFGLCVVDVKLSSRAHELITNGSYEEKVKFLAANVKGRLSIEISGVALTMLADGTLTGKPGVLTRSCAGPTECVHWVTHQICIQIPYVDMGGSTLNCYPDTVCDKWGDGHCGE